jgi:hypothetical protein
VLFNAILHGIEKFLDRREHLGLRNPDHLRPRS